MEEIQEPNRADLVKPPPRFPPFPKPPEGVTIIPFKDFKPSGIQIRIAGEGQVEIDGLGIPTVELRVKHDGTDGHGKKRKKKKKNNAFAGGPGNLQRPWWEVWEEGEALRCGYYDLETSISERIFLASHDFIQGRPWPQVNEGLRNLWDQFRLYVGLMSHPVQPPSKKRVRAIIQAGGIDDPDEDDEGEYSDEDVMPNAVPPPNAVDDEDLDDPDAKDPMQELEEITAERLLKERQEKTEQQREDRMASFIRDPNTNIRIFLSSYFRDQGLIWSEPRCRDAPLLLLFWLKYMLRSRALDASVDGEDIIKNAKGAIEAAEIAKRELPATHKIAHALPCQFSRGSRELWGTRCITWEDMENQYGGKNTSMTAAATFASSEDDDQDAKRRKLDMDEMDEEQRFKKELADSGVELLDASNDVHMHNDAAKRTALQDNVDPENAKVAADEPAPSSGWGDISSWGDGGQAYVSPSVAGVEGLSDWGKPVAKPVSAPWGMADEKTTEPANPPDSLSNPWDQNDPANKSDWDIGPKDCLLAVLGPTVFPLVFDTGVVEWSTRRIVRVEPPAASTVDLSGLTPSEVVEEDLNARLGKVVMAPWPGWDKHEKSDITRPVILPKSKGKVIMPGDAQADESSGNVKAHNPVEDEITVLVDPAGLDKLVIGMGLGATWIQIVPQDETEAAKRRSRPGQYWYMEQMMHVLPSFHTEA
ncbi:hypothetical protein GLOTRDRAFT_135906 [Gloeophyllum trabeum ATCC 11539]|uniref:Uncharacterized protein n=1 Tax=Gloeophyllum trabeum (strain ATCC 11539 / FP-39264 / Madison 617) TaxID=670483 RepID=S7QI73_GLOTA|nr:uncharacterized protein GLOTRDRAFT_135906 [Gloeophyllum trabeum ATCC 11539]EPQ58892.1 hypothetical protein GLOTRDRAFT_135906 [Gloeophyllum trabeum ATCC 11539]